MVYNTIIQSSNSPINHEERVLLSKLNSACRNKCASRLSGIANQYKCKIDEEDLEMQLGMLADKGYIDVLEINKRPAYSLTSNGKLTLSPNNTTLKKPFKKGGSFKNIYTGNRLTRIAVGTARKDKTKIRSD